MPHKALEIFEQMKREGVKPTVVTYSALISAAEKGQQWKLALEVLEEMKAAGHGANVIGMLASAFLTLDLPSCTHTFESPISSIFCCNLCSVEGPDVVQST